MFLYALGQRRSVFNAARAVDVLARATETDSLDDSETTSLSTTTTSTKARTTSKATTTITSKRSSTSSTTRTSTTETSSSTSTTDSSTSSFITSTTSDATSSSTTATASAMVSATSTPAPGGVPKGVIIGAAVGGVVLGAIVIGLFWCFYRHTKLSRAKQHELMEARFSAISLSQAQKSQLAIKIAEIEQREPETESLLVRPQPTTIHKSLYDPHNGDFSGSTVYSTNSAALLHPSTSVASRSSASRPAHSPSPIYTFGNTESQKSRLSHPKSPAEMQISELGTVCYFPSHREEAAEVAELPAAAIGLGSHPIPRLRSNERLRSPVERRSVIEVGRGESVSSRVAELSAETPQSMTTHSLSPAQSLMFPQSPVGWRAPSDSNLVRPGPQPSPLPR